MWEKRRGERRMGSGAKWFCKHGLGLGGGLGNDELLSGGE